MKQITPITVEAVTGVESIAAEAAMRLATSLSGKSAVNSRRFHSDLPFLPSKLQEDGCLWKEKGATLSLHAVPQDVL
jgi:hypothetical protein